LAVVVTIQPTAVKFASLCIMWYMLLQKTLQHLLVCYFFQDATPCTASTHSEQPLIVQCHTLSIKMLSLTC